MMSTPNSGCPAPPTRGRGFIAEEVVRTLVGSVALILAVPITTALAAYAVGGRRRPEMGPSL
ncbi:MAG TPA: YibE/F family protein [bacterium]|jgi:hypothetical protein|nr:YibE/F family protein [bacterium]